jgi:alkylation response protein AidB-like acyl-CoA dehydrogenase
MPITTAEELQSLREAVRLFAAQEIAPHAQEWDRQEGYPDSIVRKLGEQGFLGVLAPEDYDGAGGNYTMLAIVLEELARGDGGLALAVEAHNGLCCEHILIAGNDEQKKKYLPPLATGQYLGSWCLSEPGSGTDAAAMRTTAVQDGAAWILNGSKQFVTNGSRAGTYVVLAHLSSASEREGFAAFLVERGTPGLSIGKREDKLGMRSSDTVTVNLDNVRIPENQLLGVPGTAFDDVKKVLQHGRVMVSAISLGLARAAIEDSVRYSHEREAFGKPISSFELIQGKLADMTAQFEAARLLVANAAAMLDRGEPAELEAAVTKVFSSEMATRVAMEAIQIHGGYGYLRDYNVERYMRDAKLCEIGEGTSEILRVLIARSISKRLGFEPGGDGRARGDSSR